jgi:hypothetical protein
MQIATFCSTVSFPVGNEASFLHERSLSLSRLLRERLDVWLCEGRMPKGAHTRTCLARASASGSLTREPGSDVFHHTRKSGLRLVTLHTRTSLTHWNPSLTGLVGVRAPLQKMEVRALNGQCCGKENTAFSLCHTRTHTHIKRRGMAGNAPQA